MTSQGTDTRAELADRLDEHLRVLANTTMKISVHAWDDISNGILAAAAALRAPAEREVAASIRPVAQVVEQLDGNEARVRWLFNPVPDGQELLWDHGDLELLGDPSPAREITDEMVERAACSVKVMQTSAGSDYFVAVEVGDRELTPYVFKERFKAEYEAAMYRWLLNGADKPDLMEYGPDGWPASTLTAALSQEVGK